MRLEGGDSTRLANLAMGVFGHMSQLVPGRMGGIGHNATLDVPDSQRSGRCGFAEGSSAPAGPPFSGRDLHTRQAEGRLHRDNDCVELTVTLAAAELDSLRPVALKLSDSILGHRASLRKPITRC